MTRVKPSVHLTVKALTALFTDIALKWSLFSVTHFVLNQRLSDAKSL